MSGDRHYRFLFHVHTATSFDATTSLRRLLSVSTRHLITHLAITEHNNFDSFRRARDTVASAGSHLELIPAVEYSTEVGDIIVLFVAEVLTFRNYQALVSEAKARGGVIVLPHPQKRDSYPADLVASLDLYELANIREAAKSFNPSAFRNTRFIFGSDAHNWFDLPGYVNNYYSELEFRRTLLEVSPVPSLHRADVALTNKTSKLLSKIRRVLA
jgi:predicted metal-dependent phosphoesterase TrpH